MLKGFQCGKYSVIVESYEDVKTSLYFSLYDQYQRLHNNPLVTSFTPKLLQTRVEEYLKCHDLYPHTTTGYPSQLVFRCLSQYMKVSITILHSDGHRTEYPYHYRLHESTLNLYLDYLSYCSIHEVSILIKVKSETIIVQFKMDMNLNHQSILS